MIIAGYLISNLNFNLTYVWWMLHTSYECSSIFSSLKTYRTYNKGWTMQRTYIRPQLHNSQTPFSKELSIHTTWRQPSMCSRFMAALWSSHSHPEPQQPLFPDGWPCTSAPRAEGVCKDNARRRVWCCSQGRRWPNVMYGLLTISLNITTQWSEKCSQLHPYVFPDGSLGWVKIKTTTPWLLAWWIN